MMKEIIGTTEYEIVKLEKEKYRIIIGGNPESFIINATENDLNRLRGLISLIIDMAPIDVIEARKKEVCRVCGKKVGNGAAIYNYGREYAHAKCIRVADD